jgi:hypothetical protein
MAEATGLKTTFMRETVASSGVFTAIAQVAKIAPPQLTRETVDVEELAPADDFKKKLVGLIDGGEFSVTLNFDPEEQDHKTLEDDFTNGVPYNYRIQFPFDETVYSGGGYYSITGTVTSFAPQEIAASEVMQAEVAIAVVAKPEYVPLEIIPEEE